MIRNPAVSFRKRIDERLDLLLPVLLKKLDHHNERKYDDNSR